MTLSNTKSVLPEHTSYLVMPIYFILEWITTIISKINILLDHWNFVSPTIFSL